MAVGVYVSIRVCKRGGRVLGNAVGIAVGKVKLLGKAVGSAVGSVGAPIINDEYTMKNIAREHSLLVLKAVEPIIM